MAATASANTSKRWKVRTESRVGPTQQTELFGDERHGALVGTPAWQGLPTATQAALNSLLVRLVLGCKSAWKIDPLGGDRRPKLPP